MSGSFRGGWYNRRHQPFVENDELVVYFDSDQDLHICKKELDIFSKKINDVIGKQVPLRFETNKNNQTFQKIDDPAKDMQQIIGTDMKIDIE